MKPNLSDKYYKLFIVFYNLNLVKSSNYIKLNKVFSTIKYIKCFIN
jgi:hypothetical protein